MSPEQLDGTEADSRSDIWAFGALLYEMATGKKAFEGKTQASLIGAIMHGEPGQIVTVGPMSPTFDRVVETCLVKDPDVPTVTSTSYCTPIYDHSSVKVVRSTECLGHLGQSGQITRCDRPVAHSPTTDYTGWLCRSTHLTSLNLLGKAPNTATRN